MKTLIRLGSSLGTHSFCWFCHVVAHIFFDAGIYLDQSTIFAVYCDHQTLEIRGTLDKVLII